MTTYLKRKLSFVLQICWLVSAPVVIAQNPVPVSGIVLDDQGQAVVGVTVSATSISGTVTTQSDGRGRFVLPPQVLPVTLKALGKYVFSEAKVVTNLSPTETISLAIRYAIPPRQESLVITAAALNPTIDQRNESVYRNTLFYRDDQIFDTLAAGINTGQQEGGGKSLEIRRFGFNLDHGGVNGGLKVLVDDVQQNQETQGHGQGYLGALKTLSPELIDDVEILNGPFSAEYGDFSGLGVVHIRLKETLPDALMLRFQTGSFNAFRGFAGYSPAFKDADTFIAYEGSSSDGPFINPGRYRRNNVSGNYTRHLNQKESIGFKLNFGTNDFFSSGQIPLDLVANGQLNRFGFIDPFDGGRVRLGTVGAYFMRDMANGDILKADAFIGRSLFDLYSNFTFFLNDPLHGDEFQQHDSRLQEGANVQYLHPYHFLGQNALLIVGSNFHDNQINVGLFHTQARRVFDVATSAHAHVTNNAGYAQQSVDLWQQRLHLDAGLRFDYFRFDVDDRLNPTHSGLQSATRFQPKVGVAFTPSRSTPLTFYFNYGRGISSQDARGVVQRPAAPKISTTDFFQLGNAYNRKRISVSADLFLIDRSNEQVYVPDDGSFQFKGASRAYGWETKASVQIMNHLALNSGFTQVTNAFFLGTSPRVYVDSAPHSVANSGLTLTNWHGFIGSLRYRHISNYRLDGLDSAIRAAGLDVIDLSASKQIRRNLELNLAIDNLTNKHFFETQNFLESRVAPNAPIISRIHGTPGYPVGFTAGITYRIVRK